MFGINIIKKATYFSPDLTWYKKKKQIFGVLDLIFNECKNFWVPLTPFN